MSNFDYSKCRFITTSKNPAEYYLNVIKKSLKTILPEDRVEDNFQFLKSNLESQLNKVDSTTTSPDTYYKVCYYTFSRVWFALCQATPYCSGKPFAMELCEYDDEKEKVVFKNNGFYAKMDDRVRKTLYDEAIQALLCQKDRFGNYAVINFDEVSAHIRSAIKKYYDAAEKVDKKLLDSKIPNKTLHKIVEKSIDELTASIKEIVTNYNPNQSQYGL